MALNPTSVAAKPATQAAQKPAPQTTADPYEDAAVEQEAAQEAPAAAEPAQVPATVAAPQNRGMVVAPDYEDDGFGDLDKDLGFGSFPMIKLDGNSFESSEGHTFQHLDVVIHQTREKAFIKARKGGEDGIPRTYAYLPPGCPDTLSTEQLMDLIAADGTAVRDHVAQWTEEGEMPAGTSPVIDMYREVMVIVHNSGTELDGNPAILNVSPTSRAKLAGYRQNLRFKNRKMNQVLTRVQAGTKISRGKTSWYPWSFQYNGDLPAE